LEELGIDGKIIVKRILKKWHVMMWLEFVGLRIVTSGGFHRR